MKTTILATFALIASAFPYNGQEIALNYALTFPFTKEKFTWNANQTVTGEYVKLIKLRNGSLSRY